MTKRARRLKTSMMNLVAEFQSTGPNACTIILKVGPQPHLEGLSGSGRDFLVESRPRGGRPGDDRRGEP
jgi:hypothetical protein